MVVEVQVEEDQHLGLIHLFVLLRYEYLAWEVALHHHNHSHHWLYYHCYLQRVLMFLEVMMLLGRKHFYVLVLQCLIGALCEVLRNLLEECLVEVWLVLEW